MLPLHPRLRIRFWKWRNVPYDGQVNLVLTDNEEIKRVNTEFRNIQAPTDVLSFPMIPFETPADYSVVEEDESYFDLDSDELLLGDIMISVPKGPGSLENFHPTAYCAAQRGHAGIHAVLRTTLEVPS